MNVYVVMSHYDLDDSGVDKIEVICLTEQLAKQKQTELEAIQKAKQDMFQRDYWIDDYELQVDNYLKLI
jgi:hypothetical protein